MNGDDLLAEFRQAADAVGQCHLDRLAALGVPPSTIDDLFDEDLPAPIGVKVGRSEDGRFIPGDGLPHIVQPIAVDGVIVDYVAWRSEAPAGWHLRTGAGTFLGDLGTAANAALWDDPAHIVPTPLDWMRSGGCGLCVVNWASPELVELNRLSALVVPDADLAADLRAALSAPRSIPIISVSGELRHAA